MGSTTPFARATPSERPEPSEGLLTALSPTVAGGFAHGVTRLRALFAAAAPDSEAGRFIPLPLENSG
eukprot:CAMPEP_0170618100 /NCGR_PEP_ID=MMETSP0224-20130122/26777_1 /TAXON_ID=285029 /ORGANISM="Togula jolla, Strain CCCM 725" /LENGTH=66 /DNA_ID=CAMNT_0010944049 /DNA_START=932 /DNA_END=1129 /DNA_ORIENTATION=-